METTEPPTQTLYSPGQIMLAAFLGSPFAACWFFAHNYRQLGHPKSATQCVVWSGVGTVVLLVIAFFLPENFPYAAIPIGYTIGLRQAAKQIHGRIVARHLSSGGRLGSWWAVVGNSLVFFVFVVVLAFGVWILLPGM